MIKPNSAGQYYCRKQLPIFFLEWSVKPCKFTEAIFIMQILVP